MGMQEPKKLAVQGPTDAVVTNADKQSIVAVSYLLNNTVDDEYEVCASTCFRLAPARRVSPQPSVARHLAMRRDP